VQKSPGRRAGAKGSWGSLEDSNDNYFAIGALGVEPPPKHVRSALGWDAVAKGRRPEFDRRKVVFIRTVRSP
jgi:hypothetical protein